MCFVEINNINGYVDCISSFSRYRSVLENYSVKLLQGINVICGDIDSGGWSISYLLASNLIDFNQNIFMYPAIDCNCGIPSFLCDNEITDLTTIKNKSFYVDRLYMSDSHTVKYIIESNLYNNENSLSLCDIVDIFQLSTDRLEKTVYQSGNESLIQIAAIGYSMKKKLFCFPWYSKKRVVDLYYIFDHIFNVLSLLRTTVVFPTSFLFQDNISNYNIIK